MKSFRIQAISGKARAASLKTGHSAIQTPFFMPVATKGSVKLLSHEEVLSTGTQCLISNAFILSMKPGLEVIRKAGSLHKFMSWERGLFTDSGGFQVLSPDFCLKLGTEGVLFRNPFTGKQSVFSPEHAIKIQNSLGSDVAMCLDDVPKAGSSIERLRESAERTFQWAERCRESHKNRKQLLFGISQGGTSKSLRTESTNQITSLGFDGYAIGGLAIGEPLSEMLKTVEHTIHLLPEDKTRYLMGVGSVKELVKAVSLGVDCFDSAFPTRTARHGRAFTSRGNINIDAACYKLDMKPLDNKCNCPVCSTHSRAYLHHLFRTKEENARKWLSLHNLFFIQSLMKEMRQSILEGKFSEKKFLT